MSPLSDAVWRGLAIDQIRMMLGKETGIAHFEVRFSVKMWQVERAFAASIRESKRLITVEGVYEEDATGIGTEGDKPVIYCSLST